jgi:hypothetical protein
VSLTTKIFVVLTAVLAIIVSTATISFVAQTHNWKQLADDERAARLIAETRLKNEMAVFKTREQLLLEQNRNLTETQSELTRAQDELQAQLNTTRQQLAAATEESRSLTATVQKLTGELSVARASEEELKRRIYDPAEGMLFQMSDLQKRNTDLNQRVKELTQQTRLQHEQIRQLQQQRYALEQQVADLSERAQAVRTGALTPEAVGLQLDKAVAITVPVAQPIRGQVEQVEANMAQISVGSADGVKQGMKFIVYRGSEYLGDLQIELVEPNRSAGTLTLVKGDIRPGDSVADAASFRRGQ